MPEVAATTDAAGIDLVAIFQLVAGGAAILSGAVVSYVAWLCYTEFRSHRTASRHR